MLVTNWLQVIICHCEWHQHHEAISNNRFLRVSCCKHDLRNYQPRCRRDTEFLFSLCLRVSVVRHFPDPQVADRAFPSLVKGLHPILS